MPHRWTVLKKAWCSQHLGALDMWMNNALLRHGLFFLDSPKLMFSSLGLSTGDGTWCWNTGFLHAVVFFTLRQKVWWLLSFPFYKMRTTWWTTWGYHYTDLTVVVSKCYHIHSIPDGFKCLFSMFGKTIHSIFGSAQTHFLCRVIFSSSLSVSCCRYNQKNDHK